MRTNSNPLLRGALSTMAVMAVLAGCSAKEDTVENLEAFKCTVLEKQPEGFGSKPDFSTPQTIVAVIGVANKGDTLVFTQKAEVLSGNASGSEISKKIEELSQGQTGPVEYAGPASVDARGALDMNLDDISGQVIKGSAKVILSFAPSNWSFSNKAGVLNFKTDGNPNTTGTPEFFKLSTCDKSAQTISMLNRNATNMEYFFDYQASISNRQDITIDPGSDNNGLGPTIP